MYVHYICTKYQNWCYIQGIEQQSCFLIQHRKCMKKSDIVNINFKKYNNEKEKKS